MTPYLPNKSCQRILAQSLARDFGPQGIHVAYITIDASINTPWTRNRIEHQKVKMILNLLNHRYSWRNF